jgi:hypothetical protein
MPKLSYPLNIYIKAVEQLVTESNFERVRVKETTGSIVRFEVFIPGEIDPTSIWIIHYGHDRKKTVWSKDDYKKPPKHLCMPETRFFDILRSL